MGVRSEGDLEPTTSLYEMGVAGALTEALDIASLGGEIDIAIHGIKDISTLPSDGATIGAVLERSNPYDILVYEGDVSGLDDRMAAIATSNLCRRTQWLHRYPHHTTENLWGNMDTRPQKLTDNLWGGVIFAVVGLECTDRLPEGYLALD